MCSSTRTCLTLGSYLADSNPDAGTGHNMLESKLQSYFYWKAHVGKMQKSLKRTPDFAKGARRSTSTPGTSGGGATGSSSAGTGTPYGAKRPSDDAGEMSAALRNKDQRRGQAPPTKRRRVRGGGAAGSNGGATRAGAGAGAAGQGSGGGRAPLFAAATGANPEAFEEDVQKIADMCASLPCLLSSSWLCLRC